MFSKALIETMRETVRSNAAKAFNTFLVNPCADNYAKLIWAALAHQQAQQASSEALAGIRHCETLEAVARLLTPGISPDGLFTDPKRIDDLEALLVRVNNYLVTSPSYNGVLVTDIRNALAK